MNRQNSFISGKTSDKNADLMMGETAYLKPIMNSPGKNLRNSRKSQDGLHSPTKPDDKHKTGRFGSKSPKSIEKKSQKSSLLQSPTADKQSISSPKR